MKYFSILELTRSSVATARGIDNTPPSDVVIALTAPVDNVLDHVRETWGKPIAVNSGCRSLKLNASVKGAATSQHVRGQAADITAGSAFMNRQLYDLIALMAKAGKIEFDQLIDEQGFSWIHISYRTDGRVVTIDRLITPRPKRFGIGIQADYGITLDGGGRITPRPYIGLGISYNFLRF